MSMSVETTKLKQFLLDDLLEKEADEISLQIIADEDFEGKMLFAEAELIEDFLEGSLSAAETELFYRNFLTTPERIELLEETAFLKEYAQTRNSKPAKEEIEGKKPTNFFESLKSFFAHNLRPVAAVLIILVIGTIAWRIFLFDANNGLTLIEKEYAALNAKDLSDPAETANLTNKSLVAGTLRDTNSAAKLTFGDLTESVLFRLALPPGTSKETVLNLELVKDGQTIFRQNKLRIYQNQNGQEVKALLPKTVLPKGNYQIKLIDPANKDSAVTYGFAVE